MTPNRLSLTIATYNRCRTLADTLESLTHQTVRPFESLLVDNNCTDGTTSVVQSFAERLSLRYVQETRQGLSHCRNRAIDEFSGDVLLFTDDDMLFEPDWLQQYLRAIDEHPECMIFGSRMVPVYEGGKPRWIRDESMPLISGVLGKFDLGVADRMMGRGEPGPFGASFAVRRDMFEKVGHFRTDLGRSGTTLGRGEETELFERAERMIGAKKLYVGSATCHHRVEARRLKIKSLFAQGVQSGKAHTKMVPGKSVPTTVTVLTCGVGQWMKGRGDRARQCVMNAGIAYGQRQQARMTRTGG